MRLDREFYIPKDATEIRDPESDAVAYLSVSGKPHAAVFVGKQAKPVGNYTFKTDELRANYVENVFASRRASMARKASARESRKAFVHSAKVGDIYHTSWGYDQTNVEYFQIVEIKGKYATLREIARESETTGWETGTSSPLKDRFLEPRYEGDDRGLPIRRLVQATHIKIDDVRYAWPTKESERHSWSSYG